MMAAVRATSSFAALSEALREPASKDETFDLIRSLIEVIRPGGVSTAG
jgi:hypothetical protein